MIEERIPGPPVLRRYRTMKLERYHAEFGSYAATVCGSARAAADALDETLIETALCLRAGNQPEDLRSWFRHILTERCVRVRDRCWRAQADSAA